MYYVMGKSGSFIRIGSALALPDDEDENPDENKTTNIFEMKLGVKKKCINGMEQMAQGLPVQNLGCKCSFGQEILPRM